MRKKTILDMTEAERLADAHAYLAELQRRARGEDGAYIDDGPVPYINNDPDLWLQAMKAAAALAAMLVLATGLLVGGLYLYYGPEWQAVVLGLLKYWLLT